MGKIQIAISHDLSVNGC